MSRVIPERVSARIEGDFVVFLIGMRINTPWKPHIWVPAARAMGAMLRELSERGAETGFLGHQPLGRLSMVQYWRSFDALERYARAPDAAHWPAWAAFNRRVRGRRGDVGIWHETYRVRAGEYENIYSGMPPHGLGRIAEPSVLEESSGARGRMDQSARLAP